MFKKLERTKVFRDPIYGYIEVDLELISKLIDSKEVQRLRRIRQLSGVGMVFQTAEHSRFCHALGTYQMARLVLLKVEGIKENLDEYEQVLFLCASLLHDIGHGPYSHAFENVLDVSHEEMSARIITYKDSDIYKILVEEKINPFDISSIIRKEGKTRRGWIPFPRVTNRARSQGGTHRDGLVTPLSRGHLKALDFNFRVLGFFVGGDGRFCSGLRFERRRCVSAATARLSQGQGERDKLAELCEVLSKRRLREARRNGRDKDGRH